MHTQAQPWILINYINMKHIYLSGFNFKCLQNPT